MSKANDDFKMHRLECSPETIHWGYLSADIEPVLTMLPGQYITIDTVSGNKAKLPEDKEAFEILPEHKKILRKRKPKLGPHILTGPVYIEGAMPGDLLVVDVLDVEFRQNWGWHEIEPGSGIMPKLEDSNEVITIPIEIRRGLVNFPWGHEMKAEPFFGFMGVMPNPEDGEVSSLIPGYFGGNMDISGSGTSTTVYFPINVEGAGFSVGDGHALQGDGEVAGTAVETALTGAFRINLEENCGVAFPFMRTPHRLIATAVAKTLDRAITLAMRDAILLLKHYYALSEKEAYRHLSILGDVRISQLVNKVKGVYIDIRIDVLKRDVL